MKYLFLLTITLFFIVSCSDSPTKESCKDACSAVGEFSCNEKSLEVCKKLENGCLGVEVVKECVTECKDNSCVEESNCNDCNEWEVCNEETANCDLKEGMCNEDADCKDETKPKCLGNICSSESDVVDCTVDGNECSENQNGKTECVDDKCTEPSENVVDCTTDDDCKDNTNNATKCVDDKCIINGCQPSEEICDGLDNDCNGKVDDNLVAPLSEKQFGVCSGSVQVCDAENGWIEPNYTTLEHYEVVEVSCDDLDNNCDNSTDENLKVDYYKDNDNDTFGNAQVKISACIDAIPEGYVLDKTDCNDSNNEIYPNADELCDGADNNCNGQIDEGFENTDNDNLPNCLDSDDDNDGDPDVTDCAPLDGNIYHNQTETCDTIDNNCNDSIDEGCSCVDNDTQECGIDIGECQKGTQTCSNGLWGDCEGSIVPTEEICDGKDNNCDGFTDENCNCTNGDTQACGSDVGECRKGEQTCSNGSWGDCENQILPTEEICDGLDNDCNAETDENLVAPNADNQAGVCRGVKKICSHTETGWVEPVYSSDNIENYESTEVSCDNLDNDCDGNVDNNLPEHNSSKQDGVCNGSKQVCDGINGFVDDFSSIPNYEESEESCDGLDNDCNGEVDDNGLVAFAPLANNQVGVCNGTKQVCDGVNSFVEPNYADGNPNYQTDESSCDDLDNDCDGDTDENPIDICTRDVNFGIKACVHSDSGSSCLPVLSNINKVSLGYQHSCAASIDDDLYCWGDNSKGQLGNGNNTSYYTPRSVNISNFDKIDSGALFNCSLIDNGEIKCWGRNSFGQLGNNSTTDSNTPVNVLKSSGMGRISNITDMQTISTGTAHACGIFDDGSNNYIYCWGHNDKGQLGDDSTRDRTKVVKVKTEGSYSNITLEDVQKVVTGFSHSCALMNDDTVYCWGDNSKGQLGQGNTDNSSIALQVPNLENVSDIVSGSNFVCANYIDNNGNFDVKCWGDNSKKQILNSNLMKYATPVSLNRDDVDSFRANGNVLCMVLNNNTVECKGDNSTAQVGASVDNQPKLLESPYGYSIVDGAVGPKNICVIVDTNYRVLMCRGLNDRGQAGVSYLSSNPDYLTDFNFVLAQ